MRAVDTIRKKRDGIALQRDEIASFVSGVVDGSVADYQASAFLMAVVWRGMTDEETAWLTEAMVASGERVDLGPCAPRAVDKHSTGGVGDKTSLVVAPVVAACGGVVPMMSGRGLGHTGGTLDKLEAIPGLRTDLDLAAFRRVVQAVGCAIVGQTASIVPADRVLYALRDVTATVDSVPLIVASILSKKIAEGTRGLVLDVKTGRGAFMADERGARRLAAALVSHGLRSGLAVEALVSAMDVPLGRAVGNALEVAEAIEVLRGGGPDDVVELCDHLAARMLVVAGLADDEAGALAGARAARTSGRGLEVFGRMVEAQGGDPRVVEQPRRLPAAAHRELVVASRSGVVQAIDAVRIGLASVALGAGRERAGDAVDPAAGVVLLKRPGDPVAGADPVLELHFNDRARRDVAWPLATGAVDVADEAAASRPLILDRLDAARVAAATEE